MSSIPGFSSTLAQPCSSNVHANLPTFLAIYAKHRYIFARNNEPYADFSE